MWDAFPGLWLELTLEVWTNGSINPKEAVSLSAKIMNDYLALFINLAENVGGLEMMVEKEAEQKVKVLEMTIEELDLSGSRATTA